MHETRPPALRQARRRILEMYRAGLAATAGNTCVSAYLDRNPVRMPVSVVALGKAAGAMARGAAGRLGGELHRGLLVTKQGHTPESLRGDARFTCLEAGHPLPDRHSLDAGRELLGFIAATPPGEGLLFLVSGGTSSLVEVPVQGVDLATLQRLNRWLLGSGLDIVAINAIRRAVSRIKGGRLREYLGDRTATVLLISDVPGDDPAVIGSGLLAPAPDTTPLPAGLPDWVTRLLTAVRHEAVRAPRGQVEHHIIARLQDALEAAAACARRAGLQASILENPLHGDAVEAGSRVVELLRHGRAGQALITGGETTVQLPARPGHGGRCQSLALAAAIALQESPGSVLLAAGTDGTDGPGDVAGALVDCGTVRRGGTRREALAALQHADAGRFLAASGDLLRTGPTGTNVTDLVIGLNTG